MEQTVKQRIADIQRGDVPVGYQKTKLGIVPTDWSTPELNSVLTENKERNRLNKFGKEDVLSVSGEFGVTNQIELLGRSFAGASVKDYHIVEAGNIVYTKSPLKENPYGIIKLNKGKAGIVSTLYAVYSCKNNEVGTYLDYYFSLDQNVNNYLRPLVRKGTKNDMKINNEDVLKGCVILPPESEIAKIVEIFGYCDRVIALKKELIAEKKKQKKALMQKLLNPDSGFRLPGFSGEWKRTKMENIAPLQRGFDLPNSQLKQGEYPVVYSNGVMAFHNEFMVTAPGVVTGRSGTIGAVFYIENNFWPHNTSLWVTNFFNNIPLFVYHLYQFINIEKCASGSGVPTLNRNDVHKIEISIPCDKDEQQVIADILSAADKEIDLLEQELAQQEQKKKSLMQLLLTGIVRV